MKYTEADIPSLVSCIESWRRSYDETEVAYYEKIVSDAMFRGSSVKEATSIASFCLEQRRATFPKHDASTDGKPARGA